jgi:acyl-CoA reductase-like NAD-dependent aldehyde dehydrogenase
MGGKNPLVVLDDCDLDRAVQCALDGAFFATGQRCTASSRIIITQNIHDKFVEALAAANAGEFGLSAGIMTTSLKYARHFVRNVRAGMVMTNLPTAGVDYHVPFGGTRKSSFGPREQGFAAVEFYTQVKTSYTWA